MTASPADLQSIRLLLFDVDGILTDGGLYLGITGECLKRFHVRDGAGLVMAMRAGYKVGFLSGHDSKATVRRASALGIDICHVGVEDKLAVLKEIMAEHNLQPKECLFMGDDYQDLAVLAHVGVSVTVADAPEEVSSRVDIVTQRDGGKGAVRELIDRLFRETGTTDNILDGFLS